eukprot:201041-Rhodomonas_salina.1
MAVCAVPEFCRRGSIFDVYCKSPYTLDPPTALRIARECARSPPFPPHPTTHHRILPTGVGPRPRKFSRI